MKEVTVAAVIENVGSVTKFVDDFLDSQECSRKAKMQINIAIDEIFSNISYYAYQNETGQVTMKVEMQDDPKAVCITFIDYGIPYNPLEKEDPDITLSIEEREIGGLGIYMVKKNMDEMEYEHSEGKNILVLKKYL
jgi:serine/threonine-protein kinase RsbW